ncbi:DnaJ C-terminal domain-containing protein [Rhizobium sp. SSA_523]|uniref:DnaJ C-terminal domain-containing protein n=1 Tax=Rhizobium sp. SSA_523 TaxID=2952477 RepID=UPI00209057C8|nr:DnaJ C-terminal domain-containing protein [Rhizobium sp. SSA_523]MCO5731063.1 DnaJ domain-containing protein [Rhizobium sp. SSA_523]WKC24135.1 DnaJ C-terminal domain-containing protein [Rhizobium sp. SSA_523]
MRDPYSILGVRRDAPANEIKAAWRSKAKTLHPDHNQDDPAAANRFAEAGQAYEVLKDPDRRRRYDRAVETQQTILQQREAARQAEERAKAARRRAEEVMEELARANAQAAARKAEDGQSQQQQQQQGNAQSGFAQAGSAQASQSQASQSQASQSQAGSAETPEEMVTRIFGATAEAKAAGAKLNEQAQARSGAQTRDEADLDEAGAGGTTQPKPTPPLPLQAIELISALMRRLRGETPPPEKAPDLLATAKVTLADMLELSTATIALSDGRDVRMALEAGMTDGQEIRLRGQGLRLPGMQRGDLVVTLNVKRDERFQVDGYDLHTVLPISLEDAVLGGEHEVETPGGQVPISVPAWSGSDQSVRVPGLGLLKEGGERGDLIVELRVVLWDKPDAKVVDLMRHMRHGLFV